MARKTTKGKPGTVKQETAPIISPAIPEAAAIKNEEELLAELEKMLAASKNMLIKMALAAVARNEDTPHGFDAFFRLMHGTPLHPEGKRWTEEAYKAHEDKLGVLLECHRESGKTTVISKFFLAFRIGHEPQKKNMLVRINDQKASETTEAVANIIEHDENWKLVFPHVVPDKERGWGARGYNVKRTDIPREEWERILTRAPIGPTFVGYGWGSGSIIGSRVNGVLIVDDIHDSENTASQRQLAAVKRFYTETLEYCVMDGAWEVWNFTPWLTNDLYAYLKSTNAYHHSRTPVMEAAEEGEEGAELWPKEEAIAISGRWWKRYHPQKWTWARLADKYRKTNTIDFARMMLLDLKATEGFNLKAEWLHEYPAMEVKPSWPVILGIDYASTADKLKDKDRDYFAMAIFRSLPGGGLVLMDGLRAHMSKGEAIEAVMSYWGIYPTLQMIGVETIGKGEEFYNDLVLANNVYGRTPPLFPIASHGSKSKGQRFEQILAPKFQFSRIWISDTPTPFLNEFRNEWLMWPNSEHDDCLDAAYMAYMAGQGYVPTKTNGGNSFETKKRDNPFAKLGDYSSFRR